jgi:polysaccharide export outer membrane protein
MRRTAFVIVLSVFVCSSILLPQEIASPNYRIGPQDLLEITVFGHSELDQSVRVSEDGTIFFPYIEEIKVDGLTRAEAEKKIKYLLEEKLLQDAQVTVFIREFQSKKVSLLGAVRNPGQFGLHGPQTLLELISRAGGFSEEVGDEIIVIRRLQDRTTRPLTISIKDLVQNGDPMLNIPLQANDVINVPKDELVKIYLAGEIANPGVLEIKKSKMPTLLQAIIQRGGFTRRAAQKKVKIKRIGDDGEEQIITVNAKFILKGKKKDILLEENDVVYIPETIF